MPLQIRFPFFLLAAGLFLPAQGRLLAQKIIWAKQLSAADATAEIVGLDLIENEVLLRIRSDKNLTAGRKQLDFRDASEVRILKLSESGDLSPADSLPSGEGQRKGESEAALSLRSRSRNGNSYLAYARSSAMLIPGNTEWNLAFLDGNGNRLWDVALRQGLKVNALCLMQDGNCLLTGAITGPEKKSDIWFGIYNNNGREISQTRLGGKSEDEALACCQDAEGNLFIAGFCSPDSVFLGNSQDLSGRDKDGFIASFDKKGNEKFFYRQRGQGLCRTEQIASLADGSLIFASSLSGSDWKLPPFGFPRQGKQDIVIGLINPASGKEKENALRIFPNPAREILYFGLQKAEWKGKAKASLKRKDGSILQEMEIRPEAGSSYHFNVSNMAPGTYYLSLKSSKKEISERVLVE